jgi:hypothetical protein
VQVMICNVPSRSPLLVVHAEICISGARRIRRLAREP